AQSGRHPLPAALSGFHSWCGTHDTALMAQYSWHKYSWPRPYRHGRTARIAFAVRGHQNPSIRAGKRRQRQIFAGQGLNLAGASPHRDNLGEAHGRGHLATERQNLRRLTIAVSRSREPVEQTTPDNKPDTERGIEPARQ